MDIDQQLKDLINNAPKDGTTPAAVEAIAPALKLVAAQLQHQQYYVLQNLTQQWVVTTISNRNQPSLAKNAIYAFASLKDATTNPYSKDPQILALPVPVTHILFQMLAMKTVDSLIFLDVPGNPNVAVEVTRENFQMLIQSHLQNLQRSLNPPPTIA
jgi:hypothetical protein